MKIEIDESTGLPKLPEGMYWEVTKTAYTSLTDILRLHLMEPDGEESLYLNVVGNFGEVLLRSFAAFFVGGYSVLEYTKVRPRHIQHAARILVRDYYKQQQANKLIGTYPPKSL